MTIPANIKSILQRNRVNIDSSKEYSDADLTKLYEKVIVFLNKKLIDSSTPDIKEPTQNPDIDTLFAQVEKEFDSLGVDGIVAKYSIKNMLQYDADSCYTIALAVNKKYIELKFPLSQMWIDILANYGNLPQNIEDTL